MCFLLSDKTAIITEFCTLVTRVLYAAVPKDGHGELVIVPLMEYGTATKTLFNN